MAIHSASDLNQTFRALADPTRRSMLAMVAKRGECTAGELGEPFDMAQPTASKHLRVLEDAGLVKRHVHGRVHRFRLDAQPLDEAERWLSRHRGFWQKTLARLGDVLGDLEGRHGR
jgi:DNA-binding transcriptional ArsR family regulator